MVRHLESHGVLDLVEHGGLMDSLLFLVVRSQSDSVVPFCSRLRCRSGTEFGVFLFLNEDKTLAWRSPCFIIDRGPSHRTAESTQYH